MKKIIKHKKLILLAIIIISVIVISNINNKNNISYTSIGDSYSLGIDSYGDINGYNKLFKEYLRENNQLNNYNELSNKDMSINDLYTNILVNKNNIKRNLRESKIVTLSIGLNDLRYKLSLNNINDYKLNKIINEINIDLDKLLKEIKKYHKHSIYVIGYYYKDNDDIYLVEGIKKLNNLYKKKKYIIYIYEEKIQKNNKKYLINPNNMYLNKEGYKLLELKLLKKLEK